MSELDHLFEKIAVGDIPSYKIYEDENIFAFLDINPASRGHTLIIPKKRYQFVHELPDETAAAIGRILPRLAKAVIQAVGATDYNILSNNGSPAGQVIPHVHFHIIPKFPKETQGGSGLQHTWHHSPINENEAQQLAKQITQNLRSYN